MTTVWAKSSIEKAFLSDTVRWYRHTLLSLTAEDHPSQPTRSPSDSLMTAIVQWLFVWFLKQSPVFNKRIAPTDASQADLAWIAAVLPTSEMRIDLSLEQWRSELFALFDRYSFSIDEMTSACQGLNPTILSQVLQALMAVHLTSETLHRKQIGSFDTPPEIVKSMVDEALVAALQEVDVPADCLQHWSELFSDHTLATSFSQAEKSVLVRAIASLKVIDPACGSGAFPLGILHRLVTILSKLDPDNQLLFEITLSAKQDEQVTPNYYRKRYLLEQCIYGVDIQPIAIQVTQFRCFLSVLAEVSHWNLQERSLISSFHLRVANALIPDSNFLESERFDIAITNPPYVDSEEMVKTQPELRKAYSSTFQSAKGNWDLFVIFIERGIQLLKTGGILAYIVPNKLVAATYTKTLREMLSRYAILALKDYAQVRLFEDAHVYPIVLMMQKEESQSSVRTAVMANLTQAKHSTIVPATLFYQDTHWDRYFVSEPVLQLMSKLALFPRLATYCPTIVSAATVSEAYALKPLIREQTIAQPSHFKKFINTGTIDRYQSRWGRHPIRYLGDRFRCPIILEAELFAFSQHRFQQAASPKIIIGGMTQNLECFYDKGDYLAGKSTTLILEGSIHLKYLLALLNSKVVSFWYKTFYRSLTLSGGYLRISHHEIKTIPIPETPIDQQQCLMQWVDRLLAAKQLDPTIDTTAIEQQIDRIVFQLYGLSAEEIALI